MEFLSDHIQLFAELIRQNIVNEDEAIMYLLKQGREEEAGIVMEMTEAEFIMSMFEGQIYEHVEDLKSEKKVA